MKLINLVLCSIIAFAACGRVDSKQEQTMEGRIIVHFPECADFPPDNSRLRCLKIASSITIRMEGLSPEQLDILEELDIADEVLEEQQ